MTYPAPVFPTSLHQDAAEAARDYFLNRPGVDTVLVTNSCARGQAVPDSDLDMAVLAAEGLPDDDVRALQAGWDAHMAAQPAIVRYRASGSFRLMHLDVLSGRYTPAVWDEGGGPDAFEIEIGNHLDRSALFGPPGPHFQALGARWLPYYGADLRQARLAMARTACAYDLEHVAFFSGRGLHFQAFDRLYKAFQEFLQALFIRRRVYPIAYNKWIREQVEGWLGLPGLYSQLPALISVPDIQGPELAERARVLRVLLDEWIV